MARPRIPRPGFLLFGAIALLSVGWVGLYAGSLVEGRWQTWLVRVVVWIIAGVVAFLLLNLLKSFSGPPRKDDEDVIDEQLDRTRRALAAARIKGQSKLPAVVVLGPRASAKTTFVLKSGLNAEHLAGNLYVDPAAAAGGSGPPLAPTDALNLWYHEGHLVVEVGGQVASDPGRWARLVRAIRPSRWVPALLGRPQSPRVAVVCYSMDELTGTDGPQAALAAAKVLRDRLSELSKGFGIRLPVYVVFTKADKVPHFTEFVENLTEPETHQVLGATLRAAVEAPAGSFQERETTRIGSAFDGLYHSMSERRLDMLARVGAAEKAGAVYEFPREFRKLSGVVAQFLVELCKPSQLGISPLLRGFYFMGVRPVERTGEMAPEPVPTTGHEAAAGATRVFSVQQVRQPAEQQPASSTRRVPQWVFTDSILRHVVLQDDVAMGMTTAGFGLNVLRRAALTLAVTAVLVLGIGVIVGQANDRRLRGAVYEAIAGVETVGSPDPSLPPRADLDRLDALRRVTAQLSSYENGRRPLRSLLWLYSGGDLYPMARRAYFDRFEKVLLNRTRRAISATLGDLPASPTLDERDRVYNALKAHVEMTDAPLEADSSFFAPVLTEFWAGLSVPQDSVVALARAQFAFYGHELPFGNPFPGEANSLQVNTARSFLAANTSNDSFYQGLLSQANRLPSFALNRDVPETDSYIVDTFEVPGAFTSAAWVEVTEALEDAERFFNRDLHVVGNEFYLTLDARGFDPDSLAESLRTRYEADYARAWTQFLASATVVRHSLPRSESRLSEYGRPESALFRMLSVVDENTRDKSPVLDEIFRPVQLLTGPDSLPQPFSVEYGGPYLELVRSLALAAGELDRSPGSAEAQDGVRAAAGEGIEFVGNVRAALPTDPAPAGEVSEAVAALLRSPFDWGRAVAAQGSTIAANGLAAEFCSQQARVLRLYPFRSGAGARPASWEDVHAFFAEGGAAEAFFAQAEELGPLNSAYRSFKDRVGDIAATLYPTPESTSPTFRIQVNFDGSDPIVLNVDGTSATFTATRRSGSTLTWDASRAERVRLAVQAPGGPPPLEFNGTWGIFHLFHQAAWQSVGPERARVTWPSLSVSGDIRFQGEPLLERGYFDTFTCPRRIAG